MITLNKKAGLKTTYLLWLKMVLLRPKSLISFWTIWSFSDPNSRQFSTLRLHIFLTFLHNNIHIYISLDSWSKRVEGWLTNERTFAPPPLFRGREEARDCWIKIRSYVILIWCNMCVCVCVYQYWDHYTPRILFEHTNITLIWCLFLRCFWCFYRCLYETIAFSKQGNKSAALFQNKETKVLL